MSRPFYIFTNRVYPPVGGATGELLKELAESLAAAGARIVVVTSKRDGSGGHRPPLQDEGIINGVEVIRVGTAPFTRSSHWRRAMSYLGLYPQLMWQVWRLGKADAVISMTDPPLQVAAVTLASCRAKKKIHWAQDVYPELAEELGVIERGGFLARVLRVFSTWALRRQDEIVVLGRCMRERLIRRGVDASKIEVIPNWSSVRGVAPDKVGQMRERLGWTGKFVALYSGNIGLAHDFETLVETAQLIAGSGVHMVFAGEGPRLEDLKRAVAGREHVSFLPPQGKDELGEFLAAADVHFVTVAQGLEGLIVPSKAYGILAAGRPILYVGPRDSELAELLAESGAGMVFANGDAPGLAGALTELNADPARVRVLADSAVKLAGEFTLGKAIKRWQSVLES